MADDNARRPSDQNRHQQQQQQQHPQQRESSSHRRPYVQMFLEHLRRLNKAQPKFVPIRVIIQQQQRLRDQQHRQAPVSTLPAIQSGVAAGGLGMLNEKRSLSEPSTKSITTSKILSKPKSISESSKPRIDTSPSQILQTSDQFLTAVKLPRGVTPIGPVMQPTAHIDAQASATEASTTTPKKAPKQEDGAGSALTAGTSELFNQRSPALPPETPTGSATGAARTPSPVLPLAPLTQSMPASPIAPHSAEQPKAVPEKPTAPTGPATKPAEAEASVQEQRRPGGLPLFKHQPRVEPQVKPSPHKTTPHHRPQQVLGPQTQSQSQSQPQPQPETNADPAGVIRAPGMLLKQSVALAAPIRLPLIKGPGFLIRSATKDSPASASQPGLSQTPPAGVGGSSTPAAASSSQNQRRAQQQQQQQQQVPSSLQQLPVATSDAAKAPNRGPVRLTLPKLTPEQERKISISRTIAEQTPNAIKTLGPGFQIRMPGEKSNPPNGPDSKHNQTDGKKTNTNGNLEAVPSDYEHIYHYTSNVADERPAKPVQKTPPAGLKAAHTKKGPPPKKAHNNVIINNTNNEKLTRQPTNISPQQINKTKKQADQLQQQEKNKAKRRSPALKKTK